MRTLIYKDEVLDVLQTCFDTDVIPYNKWRNYIRYEQAIDLINRLQDKGALFGISEQLENCEDMIDRGGITMNNYITIVFKNGDMYHYKPEEYTDYRYDGKYFIVILDKQWIGFYNLDAVEFITVGEKD